MVKFTSNEIRDIIISLFVISLAFAFIFSQHNLNNTISWLPYTVVIVGFGFVLHELAHKFVAIRYGYWAEYKMWTQGLILALVLALFTPYVFAAPGAVYIHGYHIKTKENGIISLAGPAVNIILAMLFLMLIPIASRNGILAVAILGAMVNSFLAFFNLIPFAIFDGAKIFRWNPLVWIATMALALILLGYTVFGINFIGLL